MEQIFYYFISWHNSLFEKGIEQRQWDSHLLGI